jgi:CHAT domain-containing protein
MLTRIKLGYAPGSMDAAYLGYDIAALNVASQQRESGLESLLEYSAEIETEARRLGPRDLIAKVLLQRSAILVEHRRPKEAIATLAAASETLKDLRKDDLRVGIYARLAEAQAQDKDWDAVLETCADGIRLVETYRENVHGEYLQSSYLKSRIALYHLGVRAAYEKRDHRSMLRWAELSKCRSVLRRLPDRSSPQHDACEIEQSFNRVCARIDSARARGEITDEEKPHQLLTERRALWDLLQIVRAQARGDQSLPEFDPVAVQAALDADEAVLYYYWLDPHDLLIVYLDRDELVPELRHLSPQESDDLTELARWTLGVRTTNDAPAGQEPRALHPLANGAMDYGRQLAALAPILLPASLPDRLTNKQRLIVSPHRLLHALPFHAMPWDDGAAYLIQRFAISYTPNLSCLLLQFPPPPRPALLALGVTDYEIPGRRRSTLHAVGAEIDELEQLYAEDRLDVLPLRNEEVTQAALRRLKETGDLGAFTTVHIATHGASIPSDTPMESHLSLHDSILDGLEIANWRLKADLVVLSACCSGQRSIGGRGLPELPGDDLFGLQAAFFAAGAKRVVGALWPVYKDVPRLILIAFHRHLIRGRSSELALQCAIVEYLDRVGPRSRNVVFWAPFFLSAIGRTHPRPEPASAHAGICRGAATKGAIQ